MFQYAFGRALSIKLDRSFALDLTMMPTGAPAYLRAFELAALNLDKRTRMFGRPRTPASSTSTARPQVARVGSLVRHGLRRWLVIEPREGVMLKAEDVPWRIAICIGYWQSHRYFMGVEKEIRSELTPPVAARSRSAEILDSLRGTETILVHVRRGDYASDAETHAFHGLQSATYYERAVTSILERVTGRASVVVLSDDPEWAATNLDFGVQTVHAERSGTLSSMEALALMSRCSHHVISNSSFSWWGAWLASHGSQQVIYPTRWFAGQEVDRTHRFPSEWIPSH